MQIKINIDESEIMKDCLKGLSTKEDLFGTSKTRFEAFKNSLKILVTIPS